MSQHNSFNHRNDGNSRNDEVNSIFNAPALSNRGRQVSDNDESLNNRRESTDQESSILSTTQDDIIEPDNQEDISEGSDSESDDMGTFYTSGAGFLRDMINSRLNMQHTNIIDVVDRLVGFRGPGMDEPMSEFESLMGNLDQREDTFIIMESLNEILERLLMMNGITAERIIAAHRLSDSLVNILKDQSLQDDLELQLIACRCLYNFLEVNQDFIHDVLNSGAVEVLVNKIHEITYIDLTEQALQTLEMISSEKIAQPLIAENNGIKACLLNLDFLTIHAQRKCLKIASNACQCLLDSHFKYIDEVFPLLVGVLENNNDSMVNESAWCSVANIISSFKTAPTLLEKLFSDEDLLVLLVKQIPMFTGANGAKSSLSFRTRLSLLNSLILLADSSMKLSGHLLSSEVGRLIQFPNEEKGKEDIPTHLSDDLLNIPREMLSQYLILIGILVPRSYSFSESPFAFYLNGVQEKFEERKHSFSGLLSDKLKQHFDYVWPLLTAILSSSNDHELRRRALISIYRIVSNSSPQKINENFSLSLSSVIATIITHAKEDIIAANNFDERASAHDLKTFILLLASIEVVYEILLKQSSAREFERDGVFEELHELVVVLDGRMLRMNSDEGSSVLDTIKPLITGPTFGLSDLDFYEGIGDLVPMSRFLARILDRAKAVQYSYSLQSTSSGELRRLRGSVLNAAVNGIRKALEEPFSDNASCWGLVYEMLKEESESMSSFEILSLGLIDMIDELFSNLSKSFKDQWLDYRRDPVVRKFIILLQECLNRSESFEVVAINKHISGAMSSYPNAFSRQIRIRLIPDEGVNPKSGFFVISAQAVSTFKSIAAFLNERFSSSEGGGDDIKLRMSDTKGEIKFRIGDYPVSLDESVFRAIYRTLQNLTDGKVDPRVIWSRTHDVVFILGQLSQDSNEMASVMEDPLVDVRDQTKKVLRVLRAHFELENYHSPFLLNEENEIFVNRKISAKVGRQLEETFVVACGMLPSWVYGLMENFSFLFPTNLKMHFIKCTSFGHSRLLQSWLATPRMEVLQGNTVTSSQLFHRNHLLGRVSRQKLKVSRKNLLASILRILELYGSSPCLLEMEFFDEVGSGLGPTLEFYSLASREFYRSDLNLWRCDSHSNDKFVHSKSGLFPKPYTEQTLSLKHGKKLLHLFKSLGVFIARSLLDSRIIELDLNPVLIFLILRFGQQAQKVYEDETLMQMLWQVDDQLANSLQRLIIQGREDKTSEQKSHHETYTVADLDLTFTLPGVPDFELVENGSSTLVTEKNVDLYAHLVAKVTLCDGIRHQIEAIKQGFNEVFAIEALKILLPTELRDVLGCQEEDWSEETLLSVIKVNHGYNKESPTLYRLVKVLSRLLESNRRKFLQFLTGSPKLPVGGFKHVSPEFTVVKKEPEGAYQSDDYLPSVMTCANYLKLPEYSLEEVLKRRLLQAITEGAGSFFLS